jgi:hypothetical protein
VAIIGPQPLRLISLVVLDNQPLDAAAWGLNALGFSTREVC